MIKYTLLPFIVFSLTFGAFWCLLKVSRSKQFFLRNYIAPSKKSSSGAILLGGAPLMLGTFAALTLVFGFTPKLLLWAAPAALLGVVGYLDDQFEIRARVKLFFQLTATILFTGLFAYYNHSDLGTMALMLFFGLGVINGANLLDGIDTYSIKYASAILLGMSGVCFYVGYEDLALASALCSVPFAAFYFFNKSPSLVHLGEIGGGIIGLNLLFLCSELYTNSSIIGRAPNSIEVLNSSLNVEAFLFAFAFMHLPMSELGISLLRRVARKKSPFCGDKLHLHTLLTDRENLSAHSASNKLLAYHLVGITLMIFTSMTIGPIAGFFSSGAFYVSYYLYLGAKHWLHTEETIALESLFTSLEDNNINAYDFSSLNDFNFEFDSIKSNKVHSKKAA
jgi:UDP-N-acetylmuramyl pentapeptide phosphotransferase/UDP-N-acetylglucosamine-1-phosphate transferase